MASFHPDGKRLITVSQKPGQPNHAQLFDLQTGAARSRRGNGHRQTGWVRINKDERLLAAAETGSIQVWDLRNGHKVENRVPPERCDLAIPSTPTASGSLPAGMMARCNCGTFGPGSFSASRCLMRARRLHSP